MTTRLGIEDRPYLNPDLRVDRTFFVHFAEFGVDNEEKTCYYMVYGKRLPYAALAIGGFGIEEDLCQRGGLYRVWPLPGVLPDGTFRVEGHNKGFQERDASAFTPRPRRKEGRGFFLDSVPAL